MQRVSESHKATIKRHLDESPDVQLPQLHRDLIEVFQFKGKYTLPQITAVTSWLRSANLQERRTDESPLVEEPESSEDIDYNTPAKIESREWHFSRLVKGLTDEQRSQLKLLLMPGRNSFDLQAAVDAGMSADNLVTYMRGDVPAANAEYIRNGRKFGVVHRRFGDMEKKLASETETVHAAYLDFFGQICPSYLKVIFQLPIHPNHPDLRIGVNVMEGREHAATGQGLQEINALIANYDQVSAVQGDRAVRLKEAELMRAGKDNPVAMRVARERASIARLFSGVGAANTKNWLLPEDMKRFVQSCGGHQDFDDLDQCEKFDVFNRMMRKIISLFYDSQDEFDKNGNPVDMVLLGMGARTALVNTAQIKEIETPHRYVSPNGNRPFISYFARLQTHRDHYMKFATEMQFFMKLVTYLYPHAEHNHEAGYFAGRGVGTGRVVEFREKNGTLVAQHNLQKLMEAQYGLSEYQSAAVGMGYSVDEWERMAGKTITFDEAKRMVQRNLEGLEGRHVLLDKASTINASPSLKKAVYRRLDGASLRRTEGVVGRNDPCTCGSGRKFKKCCMKHG